jgi:hypothetical protein
MNWLPNAKIGDHFRWIATGVVCRIDRFKDNDIQVDFTYMTGPHKGSFGYTILPQDVELLTVLDMLADIA